MNTLKLFLTLSLLVSGGMESAQACKARILHGGNPVAERKFAVLHDST